MAYVGQSPDAHFSSSATKDTFSGDGSTTAFTLTKGASTNTVDVFVENVRQEPTEAYSVDGTTLTFTEAPGAGTNNIYVVNKSPVRLQATHPAHLALEAHSATISTDVNTKSINGGQIGGRRNLIINGAQVIDKRNSGSSVTITSNDTFITDRFAVAMPSDGGSKMSVQQVSEAPEDFEYSLKVTSLTADTVAAGDFYGINQWIEGQNCSFLNWGSSDAKTVTLSFYVRSSLTGTFGGALQNSDRTRAYPFTYTISSADTWERKTITISGDTSGTWLTSNGRGIGVVWGISVGSTYLGTAGAWVGANIWSVSSTTSVLETDDATWQITGVQLEVGSTATEFEHRSYGEELALCQRYFERFNYIHSSMLGIALLDATSSGFVPFYYSEKRTAPAFSSSASGQTSGTFSLLTANGSYPSTTGSVTAANINPKNMRLNFTGYLGLAGAGYSAFWYGSGDTFINIDAEL